MQPQNYNQYPENPEFSTDVLTARGQLMNNAAEFAGGILPAMYLPSANKGQIYPTPTNHYNYNFAMDPIGVLNGIVEGR